MMLDRIHDRAHRYLEGFDGADVDVDLRELRQRPASQLFFFDITLTANDRTGRQSVVVKMPLRRPTSPPVAGNRPRLAPLIEVDAKHHLEHASMSSLQRAVQTMQDSGIGVVRVLDHLPDERALVLEVVGHPSLRTLTYRHVIRRGRAAEHRLRPLYHNVGRLLRVFHSIPAPLNIPIFRSHTDQVHSDVASYLDFLGGLGVGTPILSGTESIIGTVLTEVFPAALPLARCHGDLAPRNILVGPGGRVAAIDVLGARQAPIYEDLAFFLMTLVASRAQVMAQGWSNHRYPQAALEHAFLEGYFGGVVPQAQVRTYQILLLLDRWASVRGSDVAVGATRRDRIEHRLIDRFFASALEDLVMALVQLGVRVPLAGPVAWSR